MGSQQCGHREAIGDTHSDQEMTQGRGDDTLHSAADDPAGHVSTGRRGCHCGWADGPQGWCGGCVVGCDERVRTG